MRAIERFFGQLLWNSRYLVLVAILACLFVACILFVAVSVKAFELPWSLWPLVGSGRAPGEARTVLYLDLLAAIAGIIDGYLFAVIVLIFAMGLYELFIGHFAAAEENDFAARILLIRNVDDLKDRLAKVVFLILIVTYFEYALSATYRSPLELLELAAGIALIAGAIRLTTKHD